MDSAKVIAASEQAYTDFSKKTFDGAVDGVKDIANVAQEVANQVKDCQGAEADYEKLKAMADLIKSPWSFAYHIGKDLLVNGQSIFTEVEAANAAYKSEDFSNFGFNLGEALGQIIIGDLSSQ